MPEPFKQVGVRAVVQDFDDYNNKLDSMEKKTSGFGSKLGGALKKGALVGGVALAGLGIAGLKMASDFESTLAEVKTLLPDISDTAFGELEKGILQFSKDMGIATSEAIPALYQAISAGIPAENVLEFMTIASKAAVGGVTDLETAVDGITSVVNAYGADIVDAQKASDVMFTAVKLGKTDFDQLSRSLFQVIPTAASLGVSFEEVAAELAVLTAQGVPTSVAATQLRAAFVEASKSTTKLSGAVTELTGKSFADLIKEGKTGAEIFEELRGSMPEQEFKDLFGSVEAMNAVLAITGPNAEKARKAMEETGASAGAVDTAFETISETAALKLKKAINILKIELTKLGLKALPLVTKGLTFLIKFFDLASKKLSLMVKLFRGGLEGEGVTSRGFHGQVEKLGVIFRDDIIPILKTTAKVLKATLVPSVKAFVGVLRFAFPIIGKVFNFLRENREILAAVAIAIGVVLVPSIIAWTIATIANVAAHIALAAATLLAYAPILLLIAGIALLAFGIIQLVKNFDKVLNFLKKWGPLIAVILLTAFFGPIPLIVALVFKFRKQIIGFFADLKDKVLGVVSSFASFLKDNWKKIVQVALAILFPPAGGIFFIVTHFSEVKETVLGIMRSLRDLIGGLATEIKDRVINAITAIPRLLRTLGGDFQDAAEKLAARLVRGFKNIGREAASIGKAFGNAIIAVINSAIQMINDAIPNKISLPGPLPDINLPDNPIPSIPRLNLGAFPIPKDMLAFLEKGEIVVPRRQSEQVRASRIDPFPAGISAGKGDFNANISVGSQREAAQQLEIMLRRLAFSTGVTGA